MKIRLIRNVKGFTCYQLYYFGYVTFVFFIIPELKDVLQIF